MSEELRQLQRDYLADVQFTVTRMREHGRDLSAHGGFKNSFPSLLFLAHQLKGSGGSLGFPRISEVARKIGDELNLFLDQKQVPRPTPEQLSEALLALSTELECEVTTARQGLQ